VELGIPMGEPRTLAAYETVLHWLTGKSHRESVPQIDGRFRRCASQEGNALAVGVRIGLAADPRVQLLAEGLVRWQWPDGGWNCVRGATTTHSSFYETITPLWGLAEYARVTGDRDATEAASHTADFFLEHQLFRSHRTGEIADARWLELHWPPYYAYDVLWGLTVLHRAGALPDERAVDALDLVADRQGEDGRWPVDGPWGRYSPWMKHPNNDAIAWPRSGPSEMLTLNALRVLRAAGARA
jgi:hypothetical protein